MPCAFRPLDEIGDDQKVAGIFHAGDDAELEGEPLPIIFGGEPVGGAVPLQALFEAGFGGVAQRLRLVHLALAAFGGKPRQDRRQRHRAEGAALGDLHGRGKRLRQIGEQLRHLGAALEAVLAP